MKRPNVTSQNNGNRPVGILHRGAKHVARSMLVLLGTGMLLVVGCGGDSNPSRSDRVNELVQLGWRQFAEEDYVSALASFDEALGLLSDFADAHAGRAWTLAFLGDAHEARRSFVMAKERNNNDPDIWVGGAFVFATLEDYDQVVLWAENALALSNQWVFSHRTSITHLHLRYVLATAYWYRGSYTQCRLQLDVLEPGVVHDEDSQSLLADLQRLFISPFS